MTFFNKAKCELGHEPNEDKTGCEPCDKGYYKKKDDEPCAFINENGFTVLTYVDDIICRGSKEETELFYKKIRWRVWL